jgi:hypothetical protein
MQVPDYDAVIKNLNITSFAKRAKIHGDELLIRICGCKQADRITILVTVVHGDGLPWAFYSYISSVV